MAPKVYVAKRDFLPESARKSFHIDVKKGDRMIVEREYDHGDMCRLNGKQVFLSEEDIYRYCEVEKAEGETAPPVEGATAPTDGAKTP